MTAIPRACRPLRSEHTSDGNAEAAGVNRVAQAVASRQRQRQALGAHVERHGRAHAEERGGQRRAGLGPRRRQRDVDGARAVAVRPGRDQEVERRALGSVEGVNVRLVLCRGPRRSAVDALAVELLAAREMKGKR